jgi:hypothetical protein
VTPDLQKLGTVIGQQQRWNSRFQEAWHAGEACRWSIRTGEHLCSRHSNNRPIRGSTGRRIRREDFYSPSECSGYAAAAIGFFKEWRLILDLMRVCEVLSMRCAVFMPQQC